MMRTYSDPNLTGKTYGVGKPLSSGEPILAPRDVVTSSLVKTRPDKSREFKDPEFAAFMRSD